MKSYIFSLKIASWKFDKYYHMDRQKSYLQDSDDMNKSPIVTLAFCFSPFS